MTWDSAITESLSWYNIIAVILMGYAVIGFVQVPHNTGILFTWLSTSKFASLLSSLSIKRLNDLYCPFKRFCTATGFSKSAVPTRSASIKQLNKNLINSPCLKLIVSALP